MRVKKLIRKSRFFKPWIIGVLLLLAIWVGLSFFQIFGKTLLASPKEVFWALIGGFSEDASRSEKIHIHALHTISRALLGWIYSLFWGGLLGVAISYRKFIYEISEPIFEFIRSIPPILAFPLFLVAYNFADNAYIWTVVFGCVPIMALTIARGIASIPDSRISLMKVFRVPLQTRSLAVIMEVIPSLFLGGRLCFAIAIIIAVVSEMVFTPRSGYGIGALARDAQIDFNTPVFYGCVVLIGGFGYIANLLLRNIEQIFLPQKSDIHNEA